jgi:adenosylhomocysteine nucleosidase
MPFMSASPHLRPVAVMSALAEEIAELRAALAPSSTVDVAGTQVHRGQIDGHDVVIANTGIGKVNAALTAALLVERFNPEMAVFTGVAGGLDPDLDVGDIVIARTTANHDTGVLEGGGLRHYQAGHVPFFNPTEQFGYTTDADLLERVATRITPGELDPVSGRHDPPRVVLGTILTGDQFVNDPLVRDRLHTELGGLAVEMEGAALAQAAERLGVPHLVVRAVSDLAGAESHLDFTRFVSEVARNSARLVRQILPVLSPPSVRH